MRAGATLVHCLISFLGIYAGDFGQNGISQHRDGMIANHAVVVLSPKIPDGQVAVGLVMENHITYKLSGHIGAEQCVQGMSGTESVPKTEGAVVRLTGRHLLNLEVGVHIPSVHIADGIGLHQHMIKTCIEDGLLGIRTFYIYACEFLLPGIVGSPRIVTEIPTLCLGLHILTGAVVIDSRDSDLNHQVLTVLTVELEGSTQGTAVHYIALANRASAVHHQAALDGLAELGTEINLAQLGPTGQHTEALDGMVVNHAHLTLDNLVSPATGIVGIAAPRHTVQVENHGLLCALGEGIFMNTGMNGSRQVDEDILVLQLYHIEAGSGRFLAVLVCLCKDTLLQFGRSHLFNGGHQGNVNQVGTTRSAQVRMGKPEDTVLIEIVAAARVPRYILFRLGT